MKPTSPPDSQPISCPACGHIFTFDDRPPAGHYRLEEVERILGLSRRTLKRLIYAGKLKAIKLTDGPAAAWFVHRADVLDYVASRTAGTPSR